MREGIGGQDAERIRCAPDAADEHRVIGAAEQHGLQQLEDGEDHRSKAEEPAPQLAAKGVSCSRQNGIPPLKASR